MRSGGQQPRAVICRTTAGTIPATVARQDAWAKPHGLMLPVGDQNDRAIAALAQQGQPCLSGDQAVRLAGHPALLGDQGIACMDLVEKRDVSKPQSTGDLPPGRRGVAANNIDIGDRLGW